MGYLTDFSQIAAHQRAYEDAMRWQQEQLKRRQLGGMNQQYNQQCNPWTNEVKSQEKQSNLVILLLEDV